MFARSIWLAAAASLLFGTMALGDETPAAKPAADDTAADAAKLVQQLDNAEFSQRQQASQKLMEAGKAIFPQLEKTAQGGSREASGRAIDILRKHFEGGDDDTRQAAKAALERLSQSGNPGAAQRASEVLNPPKDPVDIQFGGVRRGGFFPGPNIPIQVAGGNVNNFRRTTRDVNGRREIEVDENGKKTKIVRDPNGNIQIEITEKQNGQDVTKKIEAKDLEDLRKKDAEAARSYEQHNGAGGNPAGGFPRAMAPFAPQPAAMQQEMLKRALDSIDSRIEAYKNRLPNDPNAQRMIDSLQRTKERLKETIGGEPKPAAAPPEKPANK